MRLKGKVALITGGAAGIGKATAERFVREGAKVVICDVDEQKGATTAEELGPNCSFNMVDVSDRLNVQSWVDGVSEKFERIDILVNNAGILRDGLFVKIKEGQLVKQMSEEAFDSVIAVNLKGVFNCTQAVAPYLIRQKAGSIVNASSTKAGVVGMTKVWARELGRYNIRVNAIAPGIVLTEMLHTMPKDVLEGFNQRVPLQRLGTPEEVANLYLFLASDEASYISGEVIRIDGGMIIGT